MSLMDPEDGRINDGFNIQKNRGNSQPPGKPAENARPDIILAVNTGYAANPVWTAVLDISYCKYTIKNELCPIPLEDGSTVLPNLGTLEISGRCLPLTMAQKDEIIKNLAYSYKNNFYMTVSIQTKTGTASFNAIHQYAMYEEGMGNKGAGVCLKMRTSASSLTCISKDIIVMAKQGGQLYRGPEIVSQSTPADHPDVMLIWEGNTVKEIPLDSIK